MRSAPGRSTNDGVDKAHHEDGEGEVPREIGALRHAAAHDGGARHGVSPIEGPMHAPLPINPPHQMLQLVENIEKRATYSAVDHDLNIEIKKYEEKIDNINRKGAHSSKSIPEKSFASYSKWTKPVKP